MPAGDREAWWLHSLLNHWLNITVACRFNKVILINIAIGYFCIQWKLSRSFKHDSILHTALSKPPKVYLVLGTIMRGSFVYADTFSGGGGLSFCVVFIWQPFLRRISTYLLVVEWENQLVLQEHFLQTTFHCNKLMLRSINARWNRYWIQLCNPCQCSVKGQGSNRSQHP